jgi:hypothetical protein
MQKRLREGYFFMDKKAKSLLMFILKFGFRNVSVF